MVSLALLQTKSTIIVSLALAQSIEDVRSIVTVQTFLTYTQGTFAFGRTPCTIQRRRQA